MSALENDKDRHLQSAQPREPDLKALKHSSSDSGLHSDHLPPTQEERLQIHDHASHEPALGKASPTEGTPVAIRPNKNTAPESTWMDRTAADRAIVASLDKLRAQDLSVHLFNTHALRARARSQRLGSVTQGKGKGKGKQRLKTDVWEPPKQWAAWPMPADEVPREVERIGLDMGLIDEPSSSRRDLEEVLLGVMTKLGRERFQARELESVDSESGSGSRVSAASNVSEESDSTTESRSASSLNLKTPKDELHPERLDDASQTNSSASSSSTVLRPVPLADDNAAATLLMPSIRHIMARHLDPLLYALHRTRVSYAAPDAPTSDDSYSSRSSVASARSGTRSRRATPAPETRPSRARKRKRNGSESGDEVSSGSGVESKSVVQERGSSQELSSLASTAGSGWRRVSQDRARASTKRRARLGLRDWSDVLGLAAMQGWDAEVIERTRRCCSALFGERMDLVTLKMGYETESGHSEERAQSSSDEIEDESEDSSSTSG